MFAPLPSGVVESFDTIILATGFTPNKGMINPDLLEEGLHGGVHTVGFNNGRYVGRSHALHPKK